MLAGPVPRRAGRAERWLDSASMARGILYLRGADVIAAMPPLDQRLDLAERAMTALVADAELPPKIGVHPRPEGSFAHAMPAALRPVARDATTRDLLGIKWVTGFPENRAAGEPPINAVVVLNDPSTGRPIAILDGGPITAQRTAAVSGVVIRRFADPGAATVAIIGAGVQGASHAEMVAGLLPGARLVVHDRHAERAEALAASSGPRATASPTAREAVADADVVITAVTFARAEDRQGMTRDWLRPDALVVAVDYAAMAGADVARDAALFLTDDRGQFLANRDVGQFDGYPDPTMTIGEAILGGTSRPAPGSGRVVASHLGVGLADLVFADAIVARATELGLGQELAR
jgi:ornithine cyclodeaminase/alanine dehydrogenase-like protein (mu-crystallin family)